MGEPRSRIAPVEAVEAFWRAANYVSVCLLYLHSNPMLRRPLAISDLKPRAVGHWGCAPSLNFIWANLLSAISVTSRDVRLFLGTGHAGASWIACTYLEGSLSRLCAVGDDEESLAQLSATFGQTSGYLTELSAQYPGVLWPSGELGYALGIAHGHSLSAPAATVVAVLGDGELETAPTSAALRSIRKFRGHRSRLGVIVNLNGLRMGGPSEISTWTDQEIRDHFAGLDINPSFVDGFDVVTLSATLNRMLSECASGATRLIFLRTPKGATLPRSPLGEDLVGTSRSHKVPAKKVRDPADVAWLDAWLRSYGPERTFKHGQLDRSEFASILPPADLLLGTVRRRLRANVGTSVSHVRDKDDFTAHATSMEAFVETIESIAEESPTGVLLTSPDELASNRLDGIRSDRVEIVEYLSEHQCLSWAIGAVTAGRPSWYTSYDAFASITSSMVTQYLKFLDSAAKWRIPIVNPPLNILLTSLGWRNVYSHQDPGFASSLLEKRFSSFRCFLPSSPASMVATVQSCHRTPNTVNCVIADKYPGQWTAQRSGLWSGEPFAIVGQWAVEKPVAEVTLVVAGDYLIREAAFAAESVALAATDVTTQVIALEELTWLYRSGAESDEQRARFRCLTITSDLVLLVTSLYEEVVSALVRRVLSSSVNLTSHGFQSNPTSVTPVGVLVDSQSSWIQLAAEGLSGVLQHVKGIDAASVSSMLEKLRSVECRLRRALEGAYDEPEWYWMLTPQDICNGQEGRVLHDLSTQ